MTDLKPPQRLFQFHHDGDAISNVIRSERGTIPVKVGDVVRLNSRDYRVTEIGPTSTPLFGQPCLVIQVVDASLRGVLDEGKPIAEPAFVWPQ